MHRHGSMLQAKEVETSGSANGTGKNDSGSNATGANESGSNAKVCILLPHSRKGVASMVTITFPLLWKLRHALHCNMAFCAGGVRIAGV